MKLNIFMVGENKKLKGGISSVVNTYFNSNLIKEYNINYQSSYSGKNIFIDFFKAVLIFIYFLSLKKVDIVHVHSASGGSFYRKSIFVLISSFFRKKIIFHIHSGKFSDFYYLESNILGKFYIKKILCSATIIIVVSEGLKKNLEKIIKCKNKLKIVPNPIKFPRLYRDKKNNFFYDASPVKILFMGRLEKNKGIYDLIEAAEKIISHEQNVQFVLCGNGDIKKIISIVEKKGIKKYFKIPGCVEDKEKYFKEANIFVLPSYFEGVPISILEAASYSLPIVATNVGGIPDVIDNGESGFLVNPGEIKALENKILKLIRSNKLRNKMGKIAYFKAKNKCDMNIIIKQLNYIYRGLFDRNYL